VRLVRSNVLFAVALFAAAMLAGSKAYAQGGLTGQITGTVVDNTKAVLPGVTVTVTNANTGVTRDTVTDGTGAYVLTNLLAGTYTIKVNLSGFKANEQTGIALQSQQRLSLPAIVLEVGGVSEVVSVEGRTPQIQVTSGERSATITAAEISDIGLRGRDFMGTLKTLPGVVDTSARDAPGWNSVGGMTINGQSSFNFSYDGIVSKDTGSNSGNYAAPGLDSIAEVKVQSSNFQAEYGRSSGASITVVTKSGTKDFRGTAAFYKRDERFNANTWDRRRSCDAAPVNQFGVPNANCQKAPYRFNNTAWTIGGPVKLPGGKLKDRLFFFWSQDLLGRLNPGNLSNSSMPTAAERSGDFSQTVRTNGTRIWIKDPVLAAQGLACDPTSGGPACFPGNIIPANRINAFGQQMLNLFPLPNTNDPTGQRQYNYQVQLPIESPRNDQVLRIDYNVASKTTFYSRLQFGNEVGGRGFGNLPAGLGAGGGAWPQMENSYDIDTLSSVNTLLHTFSPTTVLEVTVGTNWSHQYVYPVNQAALDSNDRTKVLPGLTQFFPAANPMNLVPNISYGGNNALPNTRGVSFESRYPFFGYNPITDITSNVTKLAGKHNIKAGIFIEHNKRPAARQATFNGTFNFDANTNNGFDTNFGFANALIGSINSYTESTAKPTAEGRYNQVEFFLQDNWRVARNFTLDGGVRFYYIGSTYVAGQKVAYFDQAAWDPAKAPLLYEPVCVAPAVTCSTTQRRARNPLTGEILNNTFVNKVVPGSGDFYNGIKVVDGTPYPGWGLKPAVRGGFAWDVTGDGRTSIRGGFGTFYDRYSDDTILALVQTPPLLDTRSTNFTTIPQLLSSQLVQSTSAPAAFDPNNFHPPTVYNWSLNVQRELPFKFTADVAYVGNSGRHNSATTPLNNIPYGTNLLPQNLDPTNTTSGVQAAKATDYLRPLRGYAGINLRQWTGYSNYHSFQLGISRRLSNGFAFGVSYTGSVRRSYGNTDPFICPIGRFTCSPEENAAEDKRRNYTANGSRPHNLVINYNYQVPGASRFLGNNVIAKGVLDGWQVSGVTVAQSGTRGGFSYGFTGAPANLTGGGPQDVVLTCDPYLSPGDRTTDRQFRTECITFGGPDTLPGDTFYFGNSTGDEWVGLGYINHDVTFFKNFDLGGRRTFRFQLEFYNMTNKTQYSAVDTSATFNWATKVQTDTAFGRITGVRGSSNRVIQLGFRFAF
jgi:hypothetical protein